MERITLVAKILYDLNPAIQPWNGDPYALEDLNSTNFKKSLTLLNS